MKKEYFQFIDKSGEYYKYRVYTEKISFIDKLAGFKPKIIEDEIYVFSYDDNYRRLRNQMTGEFYDDREIYLDIEEMKKKEAREKRLKEWRPPPDAKELFERDENGGKNTVRKGEYR